MKPQITQEEFLNWWLTKYHNTTIEEVKKNHPEWGANPEKHTADFYKTYQVTKEQHDAWYDWAIRRISKHYRISLKESKRQFAFPYLNVAPSVKP